MQRNVSYFLKQRLISSKVKIDCEIDLKNKKIHQYPFGKGSCVVYLNVIHFVIVEEISVVGKPKEKSFFVMKDTQ